MVVQDQCIPLIFCHLLDYDDRLLLVAVGDAVC